MSRTALLFAVGLVASGLALAQEARYCSKDGTMMTATGDTSQHQNGDIYEKWTCGGNPQHTSWYKRKY